MVLLLLAAAPAQAGVLGIDVSRWQEAVDWDTVQHHISFAIIKAGGSDVGMYTDSQFARNRDEARRLNIPRGYYYYVGGGDPVQEAEHFAGILGELQPGEVVALDMEIDVPEPVAYSMRFLQRTEELLGVKPLFYTNMNRVWGYDWRPVAEGGYPLWGAIYDRDHQNFPDPGAWPQVTIKQFTSKGSLPGIRSRYVDLNVMRGEAGDFLGLGKAKDIVEPEVDPGQVPAEPAVEEAKPRSPRPGYMGNLGDGRRNSLDSGQIPPLPPLPDDPEAAAQEKAEEQAVASESHKGSVEDLSTAAENRASPDIKDEDGGAGVRDNSEEGAVDGTSAKSGSDSRSVSDDRDADVRDPGADGIKESKESDEDGSRDGTGGKSGGSKNNPDGNLGDDDDDESASVSDYRNRSKDAKGLASFLGKLLFGIRA